MPGLQGTSDATGQELLARTLLPQHGVPGVIDAVQLSHVLC
jgi:hypothetical protein